MKLGRWRPRSAVIASAALFVLTTLVACSHNVIYVAADKLGASTAVLGWGY